MRRYFVFARDEIGIGFNGFIYTEKRIRKGSKGYVIKNSLYGGDKVIFGTVEGIMISQKVKICDYVTKQANKIKAAEMEIV